MFITLLLGCVFIATSSVCEAAREKAGGALFERSEKTFPICVETADAKWQISGRRLNWNSQTSQSSEIQLPAGKFVLAKNGKIPFFVNNKGLLSSLEGRDENLEVIVLKDARGQAVATLSIPNGKALLETRLARDAADKKLHETKWAASEKAAWKQDFSFTDPLKSRPFPEDQVRYEITLPPSTQSTQSATSTTSTTSTKSMTLLDFSDDKVRQIPFQLEPLGNGKANIFFRTDLPCGATRQFRLVSDMDVSEIPSVAVPPASLAETNKEAWLTNSRVRIRVPAAGKQTFSGGKPLKDVEPPIREMILNDVNRSPLAKGSLNAPDTLKVEQVEAKTVANGPIFTRYEVTYTFSGGKRYMATLELRANESFVRITESLDGLIPEDNAFFRIDFGKGLMSPKKILVASNGSYQAGFCGDFPALPRGRKLNFVLSLYTPNSFGVNQAAAFYDDDGDSAILFAIDRPEQWVTSKRAIWSSGSLPDNITFGQAADGVKFAQTALVGQKRFWAISLIPQCEMTLRTVEAYGAKVGPEAELEGKLTDWRLDDYKDLLNAQRGWQEKLESRPFTDPGFSPAHRSIFNATNADEDLHKPVARTYADYCDSHFNFVVAYLANFGSWNTVYTALNPVTYRGMKKRYGDYAASRASWTPEERERIRQGLIWWADSAAGDAHMPHHSMMGGHPNFAIDVKATLPLAVATFPNHPHAKMWRDEFMRFYDDWLEDYTRKGDPELNTLGGRWTENIACYTGTCFIALQFCQRCLKYYDGTSLGKNPRLLEVIHWMRDSIMSPHDGVRLVPPQGAHSRNFEPVGLSGSPREPFFRLCESLSEDDPQLAAEMRWIETNGAEGKRPDVRSKLFADYGHVFSHDFGGPHESYAHLQNINGGYRWGAAGIVYYGARGKVWTYNTQEANGDDLNLRLNSAFMTLGKREEKVAVKEKSTAPNRLPNWIAPDPRAIPGKDDKGLARGKTDQLLYDFGFAQFYRQLSADDTAAYRARAVMLLRDDYLVVADEVASAKTPGIFSWASIYDLPDIFQLKPGVEGYCIEDHEGLSDNRIAKVKAFQGEGDFLTVVAPPGGVTKAEAKNFGALVNGEQVFASQKPIEIKEGNVTFAGTYGYARKNQIALFQGTKIRLDDLGLTCDGGDFGASAEVKDGKIVGRLVGKSGGKLSITPPTGFFKNNKATVLIDGKPVPSTTQNNTVTFAVEIAQRDGLKYYEIKQ